MTTVRLPMLYAVLPSSGTLLGSSDLPRSRYPRVPCTVRKIGTDRGRGTGFDQEGFQLADKCQLANNLLPLSLSRTI